MKNPIVFWLVLLGSLIGGLFIGNSAWAKNITRKWRMPKGKNGTKPKSECDLPDGTKGVIVNNICTPISRPLDETSTQRTASDNNFSVGTKQGTVAPAIILLQAHPSCIMYTNANPYHYMGCSYVFGGYTVQYGIRYCQFKKVSCP